MVESLNLFGQIVNSEWFSEDVSIIVFLNKKDLFSKKVETVPITYAFPSYNGMYYSQF